MRKIKNSSDLLSHGDIESRRIVLEVTDRTLEKLDSYKRIKSMMSLEGDILRVGNRKWDLSKKNNVYLIGAGKACNAMAMAVDEVLGDRLTKGIIIVKIKEDSDHYKNTTSFVGGHPLPNYEGVNACKEILKLVDKAEKDDLFIAVMSGGSTALMCYPVDGISLEEKILTTDILLKSGVRIQDVNAIRRHISRMNGGKLGRRIHDKGAELIGFSIYDSVALPETDNINEPIESFFGTPVGPDETTLEEARQVISDYNLKESLPPNVIRYLNTCGPEGETPKQLNNFTYFIINTLPDSCRYASEVLKEMGLSHMILTTFIEGESKEAGIFLASIAKEIQQNGRPIAPPCVVLCAGETTTKILDNKLVKGHGGPSQEMTLSFALSAAKTQGVCLLSIDTEGTDGTTLVAGGITDSQSLGYAESLNLDVYKALREHATYEVLSQIGCTVFTGNTGTNLCDLDVMYVPAIR